MNTMVTLLAAEELRERHDRLGREGAATSLADSALRLGVTEVELVAAQCGVRSAELSLKPARLLPLLSSLGEVRMVTGNGACAQENIGRYRPVEVRGNVATMRADRLDICFFLSHWGSCHAVHEQGDDSLRCYDRAGRLTHAVHLTAGSRRDAYDALVHQHVRKRWQMPCVEPARLSSTGVIRDTEALRQQWLSQRDADEFQLMLQRLRAPRLAALQAASPDLAQEVGACAITHALKIAAGAQLPLQCRVINRAVVQTHGGVPARLRRRGDWFSAEDEGHVFSVNTPAVDSAWVVAVPVAGGWRLDLEAYDRTGEMALRLSGMARGDHADSGAWTQLLRGLCDEPLRV